MRINNQSIINSNLHIKTLKLIINNHKDDLIQTSNRKFQRIQLQINLKTVNHKSHKIYFNHLKIKNNFNLKMVYKHLRIFKGNSHIFKIINYKR